MFLMRFIIQAGLRIIVVLVVLTLLAVGLGNGPPTDARWQHIPGLGICDLPCWAGITPLQTDYTQLEERLLTALADVNVSVIDRSDQYQNWVTFYTYKGWWISGAITEEQGRVANMVIHMPVPLWALMHRLGTPDFVTSGTTVASPVQVFDALHVTIYWLLDEITIEAVVVVMPQSRLTPEMYTDHIRIRHSGDEAVRDVTPWRGFVPVELYGLMTIR